jgi:arylsulfatase A-like enzyme
VPLLVKWPRASGAPERAAGIARLIDVAPTLIGEAGAEPPAAMQGVDLRRAWGGRAEKDRLHLAEEDHEGNVLRALRTEDWKLIEANAGNPRGLPERELFEIQSDPGEARNLAGSRQEVAERLARDAEATVQFAQSSALEGAERAELSQAECENLKALGYVEDCDNLN